MRFHLGADVEQPFVRLLFGVGILAHLEVAGAFRKGISEESTGISLPAFDQTVITSHV